MNQPKTVLIHNQDRALNTFDRMKAKYPIILKTLTGSLGVGVVKIETEESLSATTQLLYKLDPNMGVLLQDFVEADYDVRAHVIAGKFYGAIKRPIVKKDFRSNVALGSKPEVLKLTQLEIDHVERAAKVVPSLIGRKYRILQHKSKLRRGLRIFKARLIIGSKSTARNSCRALKRRKIDCMVVWMGLKPR